MSGQRATLALMAFVMCGACASRPLGFEAPTRTLVIENPTRRPLVLERVGGRAIDLQARGRATLELELGRYVVHADGVDVPAPLVLPDTAPMVIRVAESPVAPDGFVHVPGGPTLMGDTLGVGAPDERPIRIVDVPAFLVAACETTNTDYVTFLNDVAMPSEDWLDVGGPKCRIQQDEQGGYTTDAPDHPVVTVSFSGAVAYCAWRSRTTGRVHRLPTELEWERMARGPSSSVYAYGDVYDPAAANQESGRLRAARSFPPTGWGVYDATGNAFEWTSSDYEPGLKVLKGGSYVLDGLYLRNAFRMWYRPHVLADDIGFRVVLEIGE